MAGAFSPSVRQKNIIRHRQGNLLVSAAAGSGKTAVLVERVASLLTSPKDPVSIDQLLIVTFSNEAARQMKERISSRLEELAEKAEGTVRERLREQIRLIPMASICTNNAFSLSLLKDYVTRIDTVDPGFRVADEAEIQLLNSDCLKTVMERFYTDSLADPERPDSKDFSAFVAAYGGNYDDSGAQEMLLDIYSFMMNDPDPVGWLNRSVDQLDPDTWKNGDPWKKEEERSFLSSVDTYMDRIRLRQAIYQPYARTKAVDAIIKECGDLLAELEPLRKQGQLRQIGLTIASKELGRNQKKILSERDAALLDDLKIGDIKADIQHKWDSLYSSDEKERMKALTAPAMRGMRRVLLAFLEEEVREKQKRNILEFHDFEQYALKILSDPQGPNGDSDAALTLQNKYRYIFIDEYQDSNEIQEQTIYHIARKENGKAVNIFMVGDVKQSIYQFRHADPSLFADKYNHYRADPIEEPLRAVKVDKAQVTGLMKNNREGGRKNRSSDRKIMLSVNYRSQQPVLDAVNYIFESAMIKEVGEIDYGPKEKLNPRPGLDPSSCIGKKGPCCSLTVIEKCSDAEDGIRQEGEFIGKSIGRLVKDEGYQYRDIVILVRSTDVGRIIADQLNQLSIPCYAESKESFYSALEIRTMINLLRAIDNPRQDIPLLGVLLSPIGGMTDRDLALMRLEAKGQGPDQTESLLDSLEEAGQKAAKLDDMDPETAQMCRKAADFLTRLERWRTLSKRLVVHDLIWQLYQETGYYLYASAMQGGSRRRLNLDLLLNKAIDFERGSFSGLYQFLRFIEKMEERQVIENEARLYSESENIVRIMTIHKSKGLEFPVVFVAGLNKLFNKRDVIKNYVVDDKLGIGAKAVDYEQRAVYASTSFDIVSARRKQAQMAEEVRILYVAMTRAVEKLYLTASDKDECKIDLSGLEKKSMDAGFKLSPGQLMACKSYYEMICRIINGKGGKVLGLSVIPARESVQQGLTVVQGQEDDESVSMDDAGRLSSEEDPDDRVIDRSDPAVIDRLLRWKYDLWKNRIPQVLSVSEIKQERMEEIKEAVSEEEGPAVAEFSFEDSKDRKKEEADQEETDQDTLKRSEAALRGTAFHQILALADLKTLGQENGIRQEIDRLVKEEKIRKEDADLVDPSWIETFVNSKIYQRILASDGYFREKPFVMSLSMKELANLTDRFEVKDPGAREKVVVQGIVDLYFIEHDRLILVDYKTDKWLDKARLEGYRRQLSLYAVALSRVYKRPVGQKWIFAVRKGELIPC